MKRLTIYIIVLIVTATVEVKAQILNPVHWSYAAKKLNKNKAIIFIKATIDDNWHIYSINQKDGGPIKTSFDFDKSKFYELAGSVAEPKPLTRFEKTFKMDVNYFEKAVIFKQSIKLKATSTTVKGKVSFMTCNDQKCLPPDEVEFTIPIK